MRVSVRRASRASAPLVVLAIACASAGKPTVQTAASSGPEQRFDMVGSGFQKTALISKQGAQGPQTNVGRYDDGKAIRGTANGQIIDLTVTGSRASGIWGPGPINLQVAEAGDHLELSGLVAGRPSSWTASTEAVKGNIGFCAYDLKRQGDIYAGSRSCAGGIGPVTVRFPSTILEWQPINIGILMALLMSTP